MRILYLFSSLLLLIPFAYSASLSDLTYEIIEGSYHITYCNKNASGDLVIPSTIEGIPVVQISRMAFQDCDNLTSITIPDTVIAIEEIAFNDSNNITTVNIGNGVQTIEDSAFSWCTSLQTLTLGNSLTSIGNGAFTHTALEEITFPSSLQHIGMGAFYMSQDLDLITFEGNAPSNFSEQNSIQSIFTDSSVEQYKLTIRYDVSASGFTTPLWNGYRTEEFKIPGELPIVDLDDVYELLLGDSMIINAEATSGYPSRFNYQWYLGIFAIPSNLLGTASSYTIDGIQSNEGEWRVEVTNDTGTTTHNFSISIVEDSDSDGIYNYKETNTGIYLSENNTGTNPNNEDTDGDTISDGTEITNGTNPNLADTDSDGLDDSQEATYSTDPNLADTSGDGLNDGEVADAGFDPNVNYTNLKNIITQGLKDLRAGSTIIAVENGQATLAMEVEQSDDLEIWTNESTTTLQIPIQAMEGEKFFRFKMNGSNSSEDADSSSDDSSDDGGFYLNDEDGQQTTEIGDGPITLYPQP